MPTIRLAVVDRGRPLPVLLPAGGSLDVPRPQLRCAIRLPSVPGAIDGIIDTGSPLTIIPQVIWCQLRIGVDFEWLPYRANYPPPTAQVVGGQFSFGLARFLVPLILMDYTTRVDRPGVIAAFATGNPPALVGRGGPLIILGLWGGVLEGGRMAIDRDPATGSVAGAVEFP
jgi:hypothetical protein